MRRTAVALAAATFLLLPASALGAASGSFDDPVGDSLEYAPDLGLASIARIDSSPAPPPPSAPPGCRLVTKPVLRQEGTGIHAQWAIKPEPVVECDQ